MFSIVALAWLYIKSPGKEVEIHVELIKIIVQGVIIGILGIWLKYLLDESVRRQEEIKAEMAINKKVKAKKDKALQKNFAFLKNLCNEIIDGTKSGNFSSATAAIQITIWDDPSITFDYLALLDNWQDLEPKGLCEDVRQGYFLLKEELNQNGDSFSGENKLKIQNKFQEWKKYYDNRYKFLTLGDDASALLLDRSTKIFQKV